MAFQNTTLANLQTALVQRYEAQPWWSADAARRAINEGLRVWNAITGQWRTELTLSSIPDDPHLYVTGVLSIATRVKSGGVTLTPTSLRGLDLSTPNWEKARGVPKFWAPIGLTEIMLYPAPVAPTHPQVIVSGVCRTPILVADGDYLDMGDEEISTLLGYALHVLSFSKGADALAQTMPARVAFYKAAATRNRTFAASSFYRKMIGYDWTRGHRPMEMAPSLEETTLLGTIGGAGGASGAGGGSQ